MASKICVSVTSLFEAPTPSTHGYPEQRRIYLLLDMWEAEQEETSNPPSPDQGEKKRLSATSETTAGYSTR